MDSGLKSDKISSPITKHNTLINTKVAQERGSNKSAEVDNSGLMATDDNVELSKTGLLFHTAAAKVEVSKSAITAQEQASRLVLLLHRQFEQSGSQALQAQAGIQSDFAANLLKA